MPKAIRKVKRPGKRGAFEKSIQKQKPPVKTQRRECGWCGKPHQCTGDKA